MCARRSPVFNTALACLSICAAGCSLHERAAYAPPPPAQPEPDPLPREAYPNVVIHPSLEGLILQGEPRVSIGEHSGTLNVNVPIRAVVDRRVPLQYRVIFLSPDGREENPDARWRMVVLEGRAQRIIEAGSLRSDTSDWRMEIRPLR